MRETREPIRLIGNPEENFYILGRKQRSQWERLDRLLRPRPPLTEKLQRLGGKLRRPPFAPANRWERWLAAYCEGLEVPAQSYLEFLAALEQSSAHGPLPTASVLLRWNSHTQCPEKFVFMDWPLAYGERAEHLLIQLSSGEGVLLVTPPGLPFLPLVAMNHRGLSVALQAKPSPAVGPGRPIAETLSEALLEVSDVSELKKFCRSRATQRLWGLVALDPRGQTMMLDLAGPRLDALSLSLEETAVLAFTQTPVVRSKDTTLGGPAHLTELTRQRRQWLLEKKFPADERSSLAHLARCQSSARWPVGGISLATGETLLLSPAHHAVEIVLGEPPQFFQGQSQRWENIFHLDMRPYTLTELPVSEHEHHEHRVHRQFALAQQARDLGRVTEAFHHIQMGLAQAQGELLTLARWVWAFWQWQESSTARELQLQYLNLVHCDRTGTPHADANLSFLRLLLEVELGLAATIGPTDLTGALRSWSELYLSQPKTQRTLWKQAIDARLDTQDLSLRPRWTTPDPLG